MTTRPRPEVDPSLLDAALITARSGHDLPAEVWEAMAEHIAATPARVEWASTCPSFPDAVRERIAAKVGVEQRLWLVGSARGREWLSDVALAEPSWRVLAVGVANPEMPPSARLLVLKRLRAKPREADAAAGTALALVRWLEEVKAAAGDLPGGVTEADVDGLRAIAGHGVEAQADAASASYPPPFPAPGASAQAAVRRWICLFPQAAADAVATGTWPGEVPVPPLVVAQHLVALLSDAASPAGGSPARPAVIDLVQAMARGAVIGANSAGYQAVFDYLATHPADQEVAAAVLAGLMDPAASPSTVAEYLLQAVQQFGAALSPAVLRLAEARGASDVAERVGRVLDAAYGQETTVGYPQRVHVVAAAAALGLIRRVPGRLLVEVAGDSRVEPAASAALGDVLGDALSVRAGWAAISVAWPTSGLSLGDLADVVVRPDPRP